MVGKVLIYIFNRWCSFSEYIIDGVQTCEHLNIAEMMLVFDMFPHQNKKLIVVYIYIYIYINLKKKHYRIRSVYYMIDYVMIS